MRNYDCTQAMVLKDSLDILLPFQSGNMFTMPTSRIEGAVEVSAEGLRTISLKTTCDVSVLESAMLSNK